MQIPVKINFHNIDSSESLETRIHEKIAKLEHRFKGLLGCQVTVESAHHHQQKGRLYSVKIDVKLPGGQLVVSHHPGKNPEKHDKVFAAMNDAFLAIERQLDRFVSNEWQDFSLPTPHWHHGIVAKLDKEENFGFIETMDGDETYFHRHAVQSDRYDDLELGSKVRYVRAVEGGLKGPQASVVRLMMKK